MRNNLPPNLGAQGVIVNEEPIWSIIKKKIKRSLFLAVQGRRSGGLFVRCGDLLSTDPQINELHEPAVFGLLETYARNGFSDFLVDIGANIGLISCQSGNLFKKVHIFEPNPLCVKVLEVNTKIALTTEFHIHPFGLGNERKTAVLTVPRLNWGGAFVNDSANSYDESTIASKDGFKNFDKTNYFNLDIEIEKASDSLRTLFEGLQRDGASKGVIKIDVEGYESVVIAGIADAIPPDVKAIIVFENWDKKLAKSDFAGSFKRDVNIYKLVRKFPWSSGRSHTENILNLVIRRKVVSELTSDLGRDMCGELVIELI